MSDMPESVWVTPYKLGDGEYSAWSDIHIPSQDTKYIRADLVGRYKKESEALQKLAEEFGYTGYEAISPIMYLYEILKKAEEREADDSVR